VKNLPIIGTFRIGNFHMPQGLEGDMYSSSKPMTFMERSSMTDAIDENENINPGIFFSNNYFNQHMTWEAMLYRQTAFLHDNSGADFADGSYAAVGRVTMLPIYEDNGRFLVHLGASANWRKAAKEDPIGPNVYPVPNITSVRFRARPELRDAIGDFGRATYSTAATNNFLPGNESRLVDTGVLAASSSTVIDTEFLAIAGPLSLQAEYSFLRVNGFKGVLTPGAPLSFNQAAPGSPNNGSLAAFPSRELFFHGGYAQIAYTLTGENRAYDRRFGKLATNIFDVYTPFWFVKKEGGGWSSGHGAWEAAVRYSYLDLDDGPVRGGIMEGWTVGLNWYLNNNFKIQANYIHDARDDKGGPGVLNGGGAPNISSGGNIPANVDGFGIRVQMYF
jgi:phosphate-selective porin OprO/OprP